MAKQTKNDKVSDRQTAANSDFDVAIIGGGPAGLSAAITLGRACRSVILFDHGRPRNFAAQAVHCYLGIEDLTPKKLRSRGRKQARSYGAIIEDVEVIGVSQQPSQLQGRPTFMIKTAGGEFVARALVFATGMIDVLPDIEGIRDFYGVSVHHCPYCDGWEHRGQRLVAIGDSSAVAELALTLRGWSDLITACTNGQNFSDADRACLERNGISLQQQKIRALIGENRQLKRVLFEDSTDLKCDAVFFSSDQAQRSKLPATLGCERDDKGQLITGKKQCCNIEGVYLIGDTDGDVQFSIVAAAEGAVAATAVDELLRKQDQA